MAKNSSSLPTAKESYVQRFMPGDIWIFSPSRILSKIPGVLVAQQGRPNRAELRWTGTTFCLQFMAVVNISWSTIQPLYSLRMLHFSFEGHESSCILFVSGQRWVVGEMAGWPPAGNVVWSLLVAYSLMPTTNPRGRVPRFEYICFPRTERHSAPFAISSIVTLRLMWRGRSAKLTKIRDMPG